MPTPDPIGGEVRSQPHNNWLSYLKTFIESVQSALSSHLSESAIHKTSDVIRTETNTQLKVEVVSSSGSETPEQGRIIFDMSQGKFFGGNGSGWV